MLAYAAQYLPCRWRRDSSIEVYRDSNAAEELKIFQSLQSRATEQVNWKTDEMIVTDMRRSTYKIAFLNRVKIYIDVRR